MAKNIPKSHKRVTHDKSVMGKTFRNSQLVALCILLGSMYPRMALLDDFGFGKCFDVAALGELVRDKAAGIPHSKHHQARKNTSGKENVCFPREAPR